MEFPKVCIRGETGFFFIEVFMVFEGMDGDKHLAAPTKLSVRGAFCFVTVLKYNDSL